MCIIRFFDCVFCKTGNKSEHWFLFHFFRLDSDKFENKETDINENTMNIPHEIANEISV